MIIQKKIRIIFLTVFSLISTVANALPPGFVYLSDIDSSIIQDMKYYSYDNFVGRPIQGYDAPTCILTSQTAHALAMLQKNLQRHSMGLKVYDCYRPVVAVADFVQWSNSNQEQQKQHFFPNINKTDLFKLGYIATKSGHSRGSTIDLTLVRFEKKMPIEVNMGTHFDFLDELSHPLNKNVSAQIQHDRLFLRTLMINSGFKPLETEWWHFTLENEPFPQTYFNFSVR